MLRPIKTFRAAEIEIEATEYNLWRYPIDFEPIHHIKNEFDNKNCFSHYFNRFEESLNYKWGAIQFPWVNNPAPKFEQEFRLLWKARPTNMRHDDTFKIRAALLSRTKLGSTFMNLQTVWLEQQSSFWDEWIEYFANFKIHYPAECIQPLLLISADFASKLTKKKGVGLYWEYLSVLADIGFNYIYLGYSDRAPGGRRYMQRYSKNLELEKEFEKNPTENSIINQFGGVTMINSYQDSTHYSIVHLTKDLDVITGKIWGDGPLLKHGLLTDGEYIYSIEPTGQMSWKIWRTDYELKKWEYRQYTLKNGFWVSVPYSIYFTNEHEFIGYNTNNKMFIKMSGFQEKEGRIIKYKTHMEALHDLFIVYNNKIAWFEYRIDPPRLTLTFADTDLNIIGWADLPGWLGSYWTEPHALEADIDGNIWIVCLNQQISDTYFIAKLDWEMNLLGLVDTNLSIWTYSADIITVDRPY